MSFNTINFVFLAMNKFPLFSKKQLRCLKLSVKALKRCEKKNFSLKIPIQVILYKKIVVF